MSEVQGPGARVQNADAELDSEPAAEPVNGPRTLDPGPREVFMDHPKPASPLVSATNCEHLRHKGMYVLSVVDPAEFQFYDKYDATAYWCTKTQKPLGPDGKAAHASACHDGRECCSH